MATRLMDDGDEEETLGGDGDDDGVGERERATKTSVQCLFWSMCLKMLYG